MKLKQLLQPHPAQQAILADQTDNVVVAASRRFGKSLTAIMAILRCAVDFDSWIARRGNPGYQISAASPCLIAVCLPTRAMVKRIYFQPIVDIINQCPEVARLVDKINYSELTISWKGNRPNIVMGSSTEVDTWRGSKVVFGVFDEVQLQSFDGIQDVFKLSMLDTKGSQAFYVGTPLGRGTQTLWRLRQLAETNPKLYSFHHFTAYDNPYLPKDFIENERLTRSVQSFRRELLADFLEFSGQIFPEINESCLVQPEDAPTAFYVKGMGVDFGSQNGAAIVMGLSEGVWYCLDFYQNLTGINMSASQFNHDILELSKKHNTTFAFADPSRPDSILDLRKLGRETEQIGLERIVSGFNPIVPGLDQVSNLIAQSKLKIVLTPKGHNRPSGMDFYGQLCSYRYAVDKDGTVIEGKVAEGQTDHLIDSLRYLLARDNPAKMRQHIANSITKPLTADQIQRIMLERFEKQLMR